MENKEKDFLQDIKSGVQEIGKSMGKFINHAFQDTHTDLVIPTDIYVTDNLFIIEMEMAGIAKEQVSIQIHEQTLVVKGTKARATENVEFAHKERKFGEFVRNFNLPLNIQLEGIKAKFDNGLLTVRFPIVATEPNGDLKINIE